MSSTDPASGHEGLDRATVDAFDALLAQSRADGSLVTFTRFVEARLAGAGSAPDSVPGSESNSEPSTGPNPAAEASDDRPVSRFGMIGRSPKMQEVYALLEKVAPSDVPVLIQGETGTGKELIAKALHAHSPRKDKRMLAENCAAVPENLLESELFGHTRGSFTGAVADRAGHFVAANGGTVFLDEIGDMPMPMQAKLLRVLQDGEVRPVGANKSQKVNVRIVAATHKDLVAAVQAGEFREDLLFRLNVITLHLPPLRERPGDVALIAAGLLPGISKEVGRSAELSPEAVAALEAWHWPGNVRELENELRRAVALSDGMICPEDLSPRIGSGIGT